MHQYTVDSDVRIKTISTILLISGGSAPFLTSAVKWVADHIHPGISFPITSGMVFFVLFWVFDKYGWQCPGIRHLLGIENFSGTWTCSGQTFDHSQKEKGTWQAVLKIEQTFTRIFITLERDGTSESESKMAGIIHRTNLGSTLSYEYVNSVKPGNPGMTDHPGFCRLAKKQEKDRVWLEGLYFNGPHRWTHGKMTLSRKGG